MKKSLLVVYWLIILVLLFIPSTHAYENNECIKEIDLNINSKNLTSYLEAKNFLVLKICTKDYCYLNRYYNVKKTVNDFLISYQKSIDTLEKEESFLSKGVVVKKITISLCN